MFGIVHSIYALESRSFVSARFQGQTPKHGAIPIPRSNACCPMFTSLSTVYLSKFFKIHWFLNKKDVCPRSYCITTLPHYHITTLQHHHQANGQQWHIWPKASSEELISAPGASAVIPTFINAVHKCGSCY